MFCRLIVAFDGSEPSRRALKAGAELAAKLGKPLFTVTVIEGVPDYITASAYAPIDGTVIEAITEQQNAYIRQLLDEVRSVAAEAGADVTAEAVVGREVDAIIDAVRAHECDLLVVGLRAHPGLVDRLTARTTASLTERAPCSILGVR